jgi:ribosome-binding factor A
MRREEERAGHRHERLQILIFDELRALLCDDVDDPDLMAVSLTAVSLSSDYRNARVHWVRRATIGQTFDRQDHVQAERALARATPFLRSQLAHTLDTKRVPDLRFVFDGEKPPCG